ncbi:helix-turn-helix domain-containing protein [Eubacterium ruminantium]|uniref:helix-turn-helix domain-containing protein n=1 Tax=Eubacterium ruminantium TaxID=42322 RepID=UPI002478413D|nr:AraC family transcriptional regulator [Eubacterium ruminantium]
MSNRLTSEDLSEYTRGVKRLPAKYGIMEISEKRSRSDIIYNDWTMSFNQDISAEREEAHGADEVQIIFNLNQDIEWNKKEQSTGKEEVVSMNVGELCIYRYKNESSSMIYKKGIDFKFKSIQMPTSRFEEFLGFYFTEKRLAAIKNEIYSSVHVTAITPKMYRILSEIDCAEKYKEFGGLFLEGKMIELLGIVLYDLFQSDKSQTEEPVKLDKRDADLIEKLRANIQLSPAEDYNVIRIAGELGVSKSKLVRLFRSMYGTSIHSYVQEQRLEYAASLFNSGYGNVTEVATLAGYNNLSHFAKEFTKRYGITPKKYSMVRTS